MWLLTSPGIWPDITQLTAVDRQSGGAGGTQAQRTGSQRKRGWQRAGWQWALGWIPAISKGLNAGGKRMWSALLTVTVEEILHSGSQAQQLCVHSQKQNNCSKRSDKITTCRLTEIPDRGWKVGRREINYTLLQSSDGDSLTQQVVSLKTYLRGKGSLLFLPHTENNVLDRICKRKPVWRFL